MLNRKAENKTFTRLLLFARVDKEFIGALLEMYVEGVKLNKIATNDPGLGEGVDFTERPAR